MSSGDTVDIIAETRTNISARTLFTSHPVAKLVPAPVTTMGKKRSEVWIADSCWTSWKNRVVKNWTALKAPQVKKTVTQRDVKTRLPHSEGGMMTLLPSFSCLRVYMVKVGMSRTAMENNVIDAGARKCETPLARTERTYENIPSDVLSIKHPIQSISVLIRWSVILTDWLSATGSGGFPKIEAIKTKKVTIAPI